MWKIEPELEIRVAKTHAVATGMESPHFSGQIPVMPHLYQEFSRSLQAHRAQFPQAGLFPGAIVIPLDVVEYRRPGLLRILP